MTETLENEQKRQEKRFCLKIDFRVKITCFGVFFVDFCPKKGLKSAFLALLSGAFYSEFTFLEHFCECL